MQLSLSKYRQMEMILRQRQDLCVCGPAYGVFNKAAAGSCKGPHGSPCTRHGVSTIKFIGV